ncbi:hypothetical protein GTO27_03470 [Candidatus Bathyarchaeota archaeon]|nr:hypothetical protein [Candidatus Bathyarchaeota archaeon]
MPIPLLVAFATVIVPIVVIVVTMILYARYEKKHTLEWYGKKSVKRLVMFVIAANVAVIILSTCLLFILGVQ